jgi:three-Cys-motif partner protein
MTEKDFFKNQTASSKIKANIVANYFPKYCKIILKSPQIEIRYLDLFAGPGIYEDGSLSTPILIADACAEDTILKSVVHLMFNDNEHIETLKQHFEKRYNPTAFNFPPKFGDKTVGEDEKIKAYLRKVTTEKKNPYPTLLFFDPFGYKGINTIDLSKFLCNWGNEIFLFFNIKRIHAAVENEKFDELMNELFPTTIDKIRKDRKYLGKVQERLSLIIGNLADEFKRIVPNLFHCAFKFQEEDSNTTSHYIIHFTKHNRGYDLVKQIYNDFDNIGATLGENGDYTFDSKKLDQEDGQLNFGDQNINDLGNQLVEKYNGRKILAIQLFNEHQTLTKYCRKHYSKTLRDLVEQGKLKATFTDNKEHSVTVLINEHCILEFK